MNWRIGAALLLLITGSTTAARQTDEENAMSKPIVAQTALERQQALWKPTHSPAAEAWLNKYREETRGKPLDPRRFIGTPSGLSHRDIHSVINDRSLGERFFEVHCDLLEPDKSVYIDPVFGDLHGQRRIRAWLVPIMSGQGSEASFDPIFPAVFMDDGEGGTSIDEWQLMQPLDGKWTPIVRGVSVRRYRDGWIRDAVDFFDTSPIRAGLAALSAEGKRVPTLPSWPRVETKVWKLPPAAKFGPGIKTWEARRAERSSGGLITETSGLSNRELHQLIFEGPRRADFDAMVLDLMHPTASIYVDPIFGEIRGQAAIRAWLADIMGKVGNIEFELLQKPVFDGDMSYSEWRQVAVLPNGDRVVMTRGSSIRRYKDGWIIYAADYFDTAPFMDPAIRESSKAAGSTITLEDVLRYRPDLAPAPVATPSLRGVTDILGLTGKTLTLAGTDAPAPADPQSTRVRAAVIRAAIEEIERSGKADISIRRISRAAGVSHNAPYFYFADKQALLMAVAAEGLWRLVDTMEESANGAADPGERHQRLGVGFVKFGLANPGLFRLMGNREITGTNPSRDLLQASIAAAQLFGASVSDVVGRRAGEFIDPKLAAIAGWAMMQGLTSLLIEEQLIPEIIGSTTGESVAEQIAGLFTGLLSGRT